MAAPGTTDKADDNDKLAKHRQSVAELVNELSSYTDTANSAEMNQVQTALAYLGRAYNALMPTTPDVPYVYSYF